MKLFFKAKMSVFNCRELIRSKKLKIILYLLSILHLPAFADQGTEWVSATASLIGAIRSMSPTIFMLGLVFLLASAGAWIWFPKSRHLTGWVWGSIGLIIIVYFVGTYYADPIKNTFAAVLDPIKWISPSGS